MEGSARWSRARSQLRAHAGVTDKYTAGALGIAGRFVEPTLIHGFQRQDGFRGRRGCGNGVRCGLALCGIKVYFFGRNARACGGRPVAEMNGIRLASRTVRRRFATQNVFRREGRSLQCCGNEWPKTCCGKPRKVEDQGLGDLLPEGNTTTRT